MERTLIVENSSSGIRLDKFIQGQLSFLSRTKIHHFIETGEIKVNGQLKKPSYCVKADEQIRVAFEEEKVLLKPYNFTVKIIYEDNTIIVADKPKGLVVHPADLVSSASLVGALIYMKKNLSTVNAMRPGVVHRLDKETSGLIVLAKNNVAHYDLINQFKERKVKKEYRAICWGRLERDNLTVNLPLARDRTKRTNMKVSFVKAKDALTRIYVLERFSDSTFLKIEPHTGRMHQIRVHLKFLGYPIVGDKKYGQKDEYQELFLHAHKLGFYHPQNGNFLEFTSELPSRFAKFIRQRTKTECTR